MVLNTVELPTEVNSLKEEHVVDIKCGSAHVLVLTNDSRVKFRYDHNDNCDRYKLFFKQFFNLDIQLGT